MADLLGSALSLLFAFIIRYGIFFGTEESCDQIWALGLFLLSTAVINIAVSPIHKFTRRGTFAELWDVLKRQILICILTIVVLYMMHMGASLSRLVVLYYAVISIILIWLFRLLLKHYLINVKSKRDNSVKTLIVTTKERMERMEDGIINYNDLNRNVCATLIVSNGTLW